MKFFNQFRKGDDKKEESTTFDFYCRANAAEHIQDDEPLSYGYPFIPGSPIKPDHKPLEQSPDDNEYNRLLSSIHRIQEDYPGDDSIGQYEAAEVAPLDGRPPIWSSRDRKTGGIPTFDAFNATMADHVPDGMALPYGIPYTDASLFGPDFISGVSKTDREESLEYRERLRGIQAKQDPRKTSPFGKIINRLPGRKSHD